MFTVYEAGFFSPARTQTLTDVIEILRSEKTRNITQTIRGLEENEQNRLKTKLPVALFNGVFVRNPNGPARVADFSAPSGFIVLDYDHVTELEQLMGFLKDLPSTALAFRSPRGEGAKAVVAVCPPPVDTKSCHEVFETVCELYTCPYGVPDESGKNLNRACFIGWDSGLYYNSDPVPVLTGRHSRALNKVDPDESYELWLTVIMALHSESPDNNLELAHAWSKKGTKYDRDALDSRWNAFVADGGTTIRALYEAAGMPDSASALITVDEDGLAAALSLLECPIEWNIRTQRLTLSNNALSYNAYDSQLVRQIAQRCSMAIGRAERPARFTKNMLYDWLPSVVPHIDAFKNYLEGLPDWDLESESLLMQVPATVLGITEEVEAVSELFMKWMLGIVTLQFDNRAPLDFTPILVGKQGSGKTRFVRELLPPEMYMYYVDVSLTSTPDVVKLLEKVIGCVIVEFSELQEGSRMGIGALRSLLSSTSLKARLAYRHDAADYPVTWGIMGTANPGTGVLPESAEGRRWYAINTHIEDVGGPQAMSNWLQDNRDALWSEALARFRAGEPFQLSSKTTGAHDRLNLSQEKPEYKATREFMSTGVPFDVRDLKEAAGVGQRLPRFMQGALAQAGWQTKVVKILGRTTTAYFPPAFELSNWKEGVFMIEAQAGTQMTFDGVDTARSPN